MHTQQIRTLVAVFDQRERADRAAAQLFAEGYDEKSVRIIAGCDAVNTSAVDLTELGISPESREYYEGEVRAGRWLLVISCPLPDVAAVLGAIGRHGGSVRVPSEIRDGQV